MATFSFEQQEHLDRLIAKAETGEQWAEICRLESEYLACPDCGAQVNDDGQSVDDRACFFCRAD